jgi:hypothetical protein
MQPVIAATIIGHNLMDIPTALSIISGSVKSIYAILDSIAKSNSSHLYDLNQFLAKSDLRMYLSVYTSLIKELGETRIETVTTCVHGIQDTIRAIELEMMIVEKYKKYNDSLFIFRDWRSYAFHVNIERLKNLVEVLDKRVNTLKMCGDLLSRKYSVQRNIINFKKNNSHIDDTYFSQSI